MPKEENLNNSKPRTSISRRIKRRIIKVSRFLTKGLWRTEKKSKRHFWHSTLKVLAISGGSYLRDNISQKASALAYSTVIAIVPLLAIIVGIAKGFGVQDYIARFLLQYSPMNEDEFSTVNNYIENTLSYANSGLFVGVGLLLLLYTVYNLLLTVEVNLNDIWEVPHERSIGMQIITYFGLLLLLPVLMVSAGGLTIAMNAMQIPWIKESMLLSTTSSVLLKLLPFCIIIIAFTALFMIMPNTKVKMMPALVAGIIAGTCFQLFQMLYVAGVMWVARYNAIYGSVASIFLLMLWMQLTWQIMLICAKMAYVIQHIDTYYFYKESESVSRRHYDFATLVILSSIVKRFVENDEKNEPYTVDTLSQECNIPLRLTDRIIKDLLKLGFIEEVVRGKKRVAGYYIPAGDPQNITVGELFARVDRQGTEDFRTDKKKRFFAEWSATLLTRQGLSIPPANVPLSKLSDYFEQSH